MAANAEALRLHSLLAQLPYLGSLLDLGCGTCADCPVYLAAGAQCIYAVDWDRLALRAVQRVQRMRQAAPLRLIYADLCEVAFAQHAFDAILIRHPDIDRAPSVWQAALGRLPRWLKPHGRLLITTYSLSELAHMRALCATYSALHAAPLDERQLMAAALSGRDSYALCYALST